MTTTVASSSMCSPAEATASPVPLGCSWIAISTPSGSRSSSRRFGLSTTTILPAPASGRRGHGPQDQRTAAERVQDLGQRGAHAGSFAGGDDDDGGRGHRSHRSIGARSSRPLGSRPMAGHWVLVPRFRFESWLPSCVRPSASMRTYVRAALLGAGTARGRGADRASMTEVLRHFGLRPAGGNHRLLRRWLDELGHLDRPFRRHAARAAPARADRRSRTCSSAGSTYQRAASSSSGSTTRASRRARASSAVRARSGAAGGCR